MKTAPLQNCLPCDFIPRLGSKLTLAEVNEIRALRRMPSGSGRPTLHALARRYSVSYRTIWRVSNGHSWVRSRSNARKLTVPKIVVIRERAGRREPYKNMAEDFGVSIVSICQIVNRLTWKHVA